MNELDKKNKIRCILFPALISPPIAIVSIMLIVGSLVYLFYTFKPLQLNNAAVINLFWFLPVFGLLGLYLYVFLIIFPILIWVAKRKEQIKLAVHGLFLLFSLLIAIALITAKAPLLLVLLYYLLLILPCILICSFSFIYFYSKLQKKMQVSIENGTGG